MFKTFTLVHPTSVNIEIVICTACVINIKKLHSSTKLIVSLEKYENKMKGKGHVKFSKVLKCF